MVWLIGIDEAGYGPNLGPFVMTAVACRVPDAAPCGDLWQRLADAVRRDGEADDGRLLVADSKVVYSPARGLAALEIAVLAAVGPRPPTLADYIDRLCPSHHAELRREPWYTGATPLPVESSCPDCDLARERLAAACRDAGVVCELVGSIVVCPEQFNTLAERAGSKGAVLRHALAELIRASWRLEGPLAFIIDKHGGRNSYAAQLQDAVPEGIVVAHQEGRAGSVYSVSGLRREVHFTFRPRADADHFSVALASMVSKYLREVLMREFNRFWQQHVPGLKPTAGYPGDAARFFAEIRPVLRRLGIAEETVWRRR